MKAVMLLHGYITDSDDFGPIFKYLKKEYDLVVPLTLPGHGKKPKYKNFKFNNTISLILDTYDKLAMVYDSIDLIGFSLGGALATYLSNVRKINKLVLLSPANKFLRIGFFTKFFKTNRMYYKRYKILKKKGNPRAYEYLGKVRDTTLNNKISLKLGIFHIIPHYTIHTIRVFIKLIKYSNKHLKINNTKTLVIWGELDQLVPYKSIVYIKRYFKNIKEIKYEDISHLMLRSVNSMKIVDEIFSFLSE